ncbi:MAG: hypothetical protein JRH17_23045, partial [Deltaproteobacteria bacterium]|nr:hypothetical protein [Deltaproteobacteria bacterium]
MSSNETGIPVGRVLTDAYNFRHERIRHQNVSRTPGAANGVGNLGEIVGPEGSGEATQLPVALEKLQHGIG